MAEDFASLRTIPRNEYDGQKLVSIRFLQQHVTVKSVQSHLRSLDIQISDAVLQHVVARGQRLFAILALLEREHEVDAILSSLEDEMLPFTTKEAIPPVVGKSPEQISTFWDHQAKFPPELRLQKHLRELPGSIQLPSSKHLSGRLRLGLMVRSSKSK
jgi:hypothetical protein